MTRSRRQYWLYIMANEGRTIYVGSTSNLAARVRQHKDGHGGAFTAKYRLTKLVYFEETDDAAAVVARERQLKGWLRARKVALVEAADPEWVDLSERWFG
jgi:putative endonuclease